MSIAFMEAQEQAAANRSALPHFAEFRSHRERLTTLVWEAAAHGVRPELCVLGAGNVNDLDLPRLATRFERIHLVDLDAEAIRAACRRQDAGTRARLVCHAPVELSGMHDRFERWSRFELRPEELMDHAAITAEAIRRTLGHFDVVVSTCVLSQMQLSLLRCIGERHRLFEALRITLNVTHWRTLLALTAPSGRALFVTDVSSDAIADLRDITCGDAAVARVRELSAAGKVFAFAEPSRLRELFDEDPELGSKARLSDFRDAWVWQNGPGARFLVYALELVHARQ